MHKLGSQSSNRKNYSFTKESGGSTKFEPFANRRKIELRRESAKQWVAHAIQSDIGTRSPRTARVPDQPERQVEVIPLIQSDPQPKRVLPAIAVERTVEAMPQKANATPEGLARKGRWEQRSRDLRRVARVEKNSSPEDTAFMSGAIKLPPEHDKSMDRAGAKGIRYAQQKRINRSQKTAGQLALGAYKPVQSSPGASPATTGTPIVQTTNVTGTCVIGTTKATGTSVIGTTKATGTSVIGTGALKDTVARSAAKRPPAQFFAHLNRDLPEESLAEYEQRKEKREGIVYLISQYGPDKKLIDYETPPGIYEERNPPRLIGTLGKAFDMLAVDAMNELDKPQP